VIISLRFAAIASVMAAVACTPVLAQTTGTIPPQSPPPEVTPPTASQFSSNELINAGSHFFGGVSHGLAMIVEKAVSQWGLPNGYVLGQEASGAFIGGLRQAPHQPAILGKRYEADPLCRLAMKEC
jgi:hypothetical protein